MRDAPRPPAAVPGVPVPSDEDRLVRLLAGRRDHIEHRFAVCRLDTRQESIGRHVTELPLEGPCSAASHCRVALVGRPIGVALEHMQPEPLLAQTSGQGQNIVDTGGASERQAAGARERARRRLVRADLLDLERGQTRAGEGKAQIGPAGSKLALQPAGRGWLVQEPEESGVGHDWVWFYSEAR